MLGALLLVLTLLSGGEGKGECYGKLLLAFFYECYERMRIVLFAYLFARVCVLAALTEAALTQNLHQAVSTENLERIRTRFASNNHSLLSADIDEFSYRNA